MTKTKDQTLWIDQQFGLQFLQFAAQLGYVSVQGGEEFLHSGVSDGQSVPNEATQQVHGWFQLGKGNLILWADGNGVLVNQLVQLTNVVFLLFKNYHLVR